MILPLREYRVTLSRSTQAIMRKPSHFVSNTQSGSSKGASVSVASMGWRRFGSLETRVMASVAPSGQHASEGDGIAQLRDRRNAVLPVASGRTAKQIDRSWLEREVCALPFCTHSSPQAKNAGRQQRETDDVSEHRTILVP